MRRTPVCLHENAPNFRACMERLQEIVNGRQDICITPYSSSDGVHWFRGFWRIGDRVAWYLEASDSVAREEVKEIADILAETAWAASGSPKSGGN